MNFVLLLCLIVRPQVPLDQLGLDAFEHLLQELSINLGVAATAKR
jgi:hypothetical protein